MSRTATIPWGAFGAKHKAYIHNAKAMRMAVAEGAIRSGKTIDHCILAAQYLETTPDKFHLATGSTIGNAKLNIGVCNGFGLEAMFRGRCKWGKYKDNEALYLNTQTGQKIVIFAGGGSFQKLAEKHGVSIDTVKRRGSKEGWSKERTKTTPKLHQKTVRLAVQKKAEQGADRITRLLDVGDDTHSQAIYCATINGY